MTSHMLSCLPFRTRVIALFCLLGSAWLLAAQTEESALVDLDTYVVTASGFEQTLAKAPASISVVFNTDLVQRRASSLAEVLSEMEGIDVGASVGKTGGMNISMRGMPSDYTLVLIDGRRQNTAGNVTPNGFGETSSSFLPPPSAIERIEVIRGPMSTLYGSDAMGGVINLITRKVRNTWGGSLTAGGTVQSDSDYGGSYQSNLYVSGPLVADRLGLVVRGGWYERFESDLEYLDAEGNPLEVSKRGPSPVAGKTHNVGGRLTWLASADHELWFDVDLHRQRYDNAQAQLGTLGERGYAEVLRFHRDQWTLSHQWILDWGRLDTSLMQNVTETFGRTIPNGTPGKEPGSPRDLENENRVLDSHLVANLGDHTLVVGGQWWDAEMIDGVAPAPYTHTQWALFAEDAWELLEGLTLTVGARHDDHNRFGSHFNPRAYLVWQATPSWTLKGGISKGFKAPRLDQISEGITGFTGQGTRPTIGTPTLQPETSVTTEISAIFDNQTGLRVVITGFHNSFDDKIANGPGLLNATWADEPNRPGSVDYGYWPLVDTFSQLINVDEAVTQGVEMNARWKLSGRWEVSGNYTFTDSEQKSGDSKGQPLYNTPEHMLNARLNFTANEALNFWFSSEYRSERYRSPSRSSTSLEKETLGDYRAYTVFNLGGNWRVHEQLTLSAVIYNLLNKDFVDYQPYVSNRNTGAISYSNRFANPMEPLRLWISANWQF